MRRALILGVTGQDGQFLANLLLNLNYEVLGASRNLPNWRNNPLGLLRSEHKKIGVTTRGTQLYNFRVYDEVGIEVDGLDEHLKLIGLVK